MREIKENPENILENSMGNSSLMDSMVSDGTV